MSTDRSIDLAQVWDRVWAARRGVAMMVLAATLIMTATAFLLPKWYTAHSSLLPPGEDDSGLKLTTLLRGIGVPGLRVPTQASPSDVFVAILESRRINEEIIDRFDLKTVYKKKFTEEALKELGRHTDFKVTEAGTIDITVEARDPQRAADMANAYVELLDLFNREVRTTKGRRTREFVEGRLEETKSQLADAEKQLAQYQSENKTIALTPEMSSSVETAAQLYAERAALQVRLGVVQNYSRGRSDEEIQLEQRLRELDRQLGLLPETGLELARLLRDVKTFEQLYLLLMAEYEDARIAEARDVATVEALDIASIPERKSKPRRGLLIIAGFVIGLAVGVAWALLRKESDATTEAASS